MNGKSNAKVPGRKEMVQVHCGAMWAKNGEGLFTLVETHGLQEPSQSKIVVSMKVGDKDFIDFGGGNQGNHLPLGAFSTVKQDCFTIELESYAGQVAFSRRSASSCP